MLNPTPVTRTGIVHSTLTGVLMDITETSMHSHESAMHRLLLDLGDLLALGHFTRAEYALTLGMAADVLFYFNYTPEALAVESDPWYRAAVVHQMGQAMLQAIALQRPEYTAKTFYREAMESLALSRAPDTLPVTPLHCKQWTTLLQARA